MSSVLIGMDVFCVTIVMSSAYVMSLELGEWGMGRSRVKRLKRVGERMAPWGTPLVSFTFLESLFFMETWAVLLDMKLESHFL